MRFIKLCGIVASMVLLSLPMLAHASVKTPSHVFQQAKSLEMDIIAIAAADNVASNQKEPYVQTNKLPVHVYAKATEVHHKIIRLQKKLGLSVSEQRAIPIRKITPADVFAVVSFLRQEVAPILADKSIPPSEAVFEGGKTPSNVYEQLMRVSLALDPMIGKINPNLVYRNAQMIQSDINLIAGSLKVAPVNKVPELIQGSKPFDVNIEAFKNLYRIAKLERNLEMQSVRVSDFPVGKIGPSEVYDTTNNILAELIRIKTRLNLTEPTAQFSVPEGKKPAEVLQLMQWIGLQIEAMYK